MRRAGRILLNGATLLSVAVCVVAAGLWVRSYQSICLAEHASTRLNRVVSGGGGFVVESVALEVERGNWRDPSVTPTRWREPYARRQIGETGLRISGGQPYRSGDMARLAGDAARNRAVPRLVAVSRSRQQAFNNDDGSVVTSALVGRRLWVPYWVVVVAAGVLPVWRVARDLRRARRQRLNLCAACGYDLRATPGRCPECGTEAEARDVRHSEPF